MAAHLRVRRRQQRNERVHRVPRVFRDRSDPLEVLDETGVFTRFRFRPETIVFILNCLPNLRSRTERNCPVPPMLQLLVTLRYLATGAMHLLIADSLNLSRETVGRIVRKVTHMIARLCSDFVKFPTGNDADVVKAGFASVAGFPNVLGCVDGTFIRIKRPTEHEADFVNRKGYHSLNVQMTCDHTYKITSCYAAWPGSVHDSRVFRSSNLCTKFENGIYTGLLLGDSGYPCRHFLMTPFLNPNNPAMTRYNNSLCRTRVMVEQTFGILKRRFQILHFQMQTNPQRAVTNTVACVVLHNIGIMRGDIMQPADDIEVEQPVVLPYLNEDGSAMRQHIVQNFFS